MVYLTMRGLCGTSKRRRSEYGITRYGGRPSPGPFYDLIEGAPFMRLGSRLRLLRQSTGVSLRTLAEQTDFSASFLSLVENDKASPSVASIERIAAAFGLSLAEFF